MEPSSLLPSTTQLSDHFKNLKELLKLQHKRTEDKIERNARSVRCLEKAVREQTDILGKVHQSIDDLVATVISLFPRPANVYDVTLHTLVS